MNKEYYGVIHGNNCYYIPDFHRTHVACEEGNVFNIKTGFSVGHIVNNTFVYIKDNKSYLIKILIAKTFIPNPDNHKHVINLDKDITNNETSNLKWVSAEEHRKFCYKPKSSLTDEQIKELLTLKNRGRQWLANKFGVSKDVIRYTINKHKKENIK